MSDVPSPHEMDVSATRKKLVLVASATLFAVGTFGSNVGPAWVDERPAVVLALSSRNRNLFASVPFIDPLPFVLIGFTRVFVAGMVLFFLGRWYGDRALGWTEKQVGELPAIYRWFAKAMDRAGWLVIIFFCGSNLVWLMAGHRRIAPIKYASLLATGIAIRLAVMWAGGKAFEDQIRSFLEWMEDYQWYVVGGLFALSFLQSARKNRSRTSTVSKDLEYPSEQ